MYNIKWKNKKSGKNFYVKNGFKLILQDNKRYVYKLDIEETNKNITQAELAEKLNITDYHITPKLKILKYWHAKEIVII